MFRLRQDVVALVFEAFANSPRLLSIVDDSGRSVGFALAGQSRLGVVIASGKAARKPGLKSYRLSEAQGR